jgi:hypothetical protein
MLYGLGAGVVLAALLPVAGFGTVTLVTALGAGVAYGVLLFVGAAGFWMNVVLALDSEPTEVGAFLFVHPFRGGGPVLKERRASDWSEAQASRAGRKPTHHQKPPLVVSPDTPNRSLYNPASRHNVYGGSKPDGRNSSQCSRGI